VHATISKDQMWEKISERSASQQKLDEVCKMAIAGISQQIRSSWEDTFISKELFQME
jgi:hypothetical protein